jgi:hypothetical protein
MLKLSPITSFAVPVKVSLPTDTPGKTNDGDFTARFKHVSDDEYLAVLDGLREVGDEGELPKMRDFFRYKREQLSELLLSVEGIGDDNGTPHAPALQRDLVLGSLVLVIATFNAFVDGYNTAPAKNSKRSPKR